MAPSGPNRSEAFEVCIFLSSRDDTLYPAGNGFVPSFLSAEGAFGCMASSDFPAPWLEAGPRANSPRHKEEYDVRSLKMVHD